MRQIKNKSRDDNEIWKDMAENAIIGVYRATKKANFFTQIKSFPKFLDSILLSNFSRLFRTFSRSICMKT